MTVKKVKCPECGEILKVYGEKTFVHCGSKWGIEDNITEAKRREKELMKEAKRSEKELMKEAKRSEKELMKEAKRREKELMKEEEKDLNEENEEVLPVRKKKRKEPEDDLLCPFCGGDVYGTSRYGVYWCDSCKRYLIED